MTIHLIKLCVGVDSLEQIRDWQRRQWFEDTAGRRVIAHLTRNMPRRAEEVLDGGSLYWVVKGRIICRNRIVGLEAVTAKAREKGGGSRSRSQCAILMQAGPIPVVPRQHRPFQGWRYFDAKSAPADLKTGTAVAEDLPQEMLEELTELGLL